ncbi:hypothetical protein JOD24_002092 [Kroppenstedtia sanguinis]|uniref:Uncharacterized protein n=1 Tax=Kroppenstedtia sanguinis TaxID=1380684 RepID=A0ABW4C554_9BACL
MKNDSSRKKISSANKWLSGIIGLEAALILEFLWILYEDHIRLPFPLPPWTREGICLAIGILVMLLLLWILKRSRRREGSHP